MTENEKLEQEKRELNLLIQKGVNIEVDHQVFVRQNGPFKYFKKMIKKEEKLRFTIKEPTLSILDLISAEQIELRLDEKEMISDNAVSIAKRLTKEHSRRMARIIALSVLGQDYIIQTVTGSSVNYRFDDKKLDELTELFFHNVKPSLLMQYVILINTMSNLGDFTNSIRLMSAARTTMPILIEENKQD